jgi:hypothetical protein
LYLFHKNHPHYSSYITQHEMTGMWFGLGIASRIDLHSNKGHVKQIQYVELQNN